MTIYTHDMVKSMNGAQVGEACKDLGIKTTSRSNEELKRILVKESKKMHNDNRKKSQYKEPTRDYGVQIMGLYETIDILERSIDELKKVITAQNNMLEDVYLGLIELTEKKETPVTVEAESTPVEHIVFDITDEEIERYISALNPLSIANTTTLNAFERFVAWCETKNLIPCSRKKFSRRVCKIHPFTVSPKSIFVPISD